MEITTALKTRAFTYGIGSFFVALTGLMSTYLMIF
jgi:hypothetical protein